MQPAREDVVQKLTFPASTATAGALRVDMRSFPSCEPCPRASPKSSLYVAAPTIGKISAGTFAVAPDTPTARPRDAKRRRKTPRAVVRWRGIGSGSRSKGRNLSRVRDDANPLSRDGYVSSQREQEARVLSR